MRQRGLTTLELAAALFLAALLSSAVVVKFASSLSQLKSKDLIGRLVDFERKVRRAVRDGTASAATVEIDLQRERVETKLGGRRGEGDPDLTLHFPKSWKIEAYYRGGARRRQTNGKALRQVSVRGHSESCALSFLSPEGERLRALISGLTGDVLEVESEKELRALLSEVRRAHAP